MNEEYAAAKMQSYLQSQSNKDSSPMHNNHLNSNGAYIEPEEDDLFGQMNYRKQNL